MDIQKNKRAPEVNIPWREKWCLQVSNVAGRNSRKAVIRSVTSVRFAEVVIAVEYRVYVPEEVFWGKGRLCVVLFTLLLHLSRNTRFSPILEISI